MNFDIPAFFIPFPSPQSTFCFIIFYNYFWVVGLSQRVIWLQTLESPGSCIGLMVDGNQVLGVGYCRASVSPGSSTWIWWWGLNPRKLTGETEIVS